MTPIEDGFEVLSKLGITHNPDAEAGRQAASGGSLKDQLASRNEGREEQWEESAPPSRLPIYLFACAIALSLAAFQWWNAQNQPSLYSPEEEARNAKVAVFLGLAEVEAFQAANDRLPGVAELQWDQRAVSYEPAPNGFRLIAQAESSGEVFLYQSGDDPTPYTEAFEAMRAGAPNE